MRRIGAIVAAVIIIVLFYQNCGKSGFDNTQSSGLSGSASTSQVTVDPKLAKLPFPYEVSVNQIAHMSCPIPGNTSPFITHFSFAVGAYDNPVDVPSSRLNIRPSGLRLSPAFQTEFDKVALSYNASVRSTKLKEALLGLPTIANNQLQLAFRKTNTPKVDLMATPGGPSPIVGFLPILSTDAIADSFVLNPNDTINYFSNVLNFSARPLQASLKIGSAYGAVHAALNANYDASFLTIGYAPSSGGLVSNSTLVGPSADNRFAYGKGYRVHFGATNPHQGTTLYPSGDSLSVVEEYDLETGTKTSGVSWDCSIKLKIVRNEDRFKPAYRANHFTLGAGNVCPTYPSNGAFCQSPVHPAFGIEKAAFGVACPFNRKEFTGGYCNERYSQVCPPEPYTSNPNHPNPIERDDGLYNPTHPERPAILHALRRFLPATEWDINVSRRCIVPKVDDNSCYQTAPVVYDETFFPDTAANPAVGQFAGCGVGGQYPCANYLTLCVRR